VQHFYNIVEGYFFFYNRIELFTKYNLNTEVQHSILCEFITNSMPYVYNSIQSNMNSLGEPLIAEITPLNRVRFIGLGLPPTNSLLFDSYIKEFTNQLNNSGTSKEVHLLVDVLIKYPPTVF